MPNPPAVTAQAIIVEALNVAGVIGDGETPSAEDINSNLSRLNDMLAQWQRKRWLIWHLVDVSFVSTGVQFYTVGPGQNFNVTARPDRLETGCFVRLLNTAPPNQVDRPLEVIESRETYSRIALKSMGTFPRYVFYDSAYPIGNLYVWPVPQAALYEIHIALKDVLAQFATSVTPVNLPPEYVPAMKWNLARRMRAAYRMPADAEVNALGQDALNVLRLANTQVALLTMPAPLRGNGQYDPYSDTIR
jgi:hypothetical protein